MKDYKQYIKIKSAPEDIYNCLTNSLTIELWSGYEAKMEPVVGFEFELFDGDISGKVLQLDEPKLVVQEWYFGEQEEQSVVTFKIHQDSNAVSLELQHTNIPDEAYEDIANGWKKYYLGAIKKYLE
jgi:activator of HSP90 ATPase